MKQFQNIKKHTLKVNDHYKTVEPLHFSLTIFLSLFGFDAQLFFLYRIIQNVALLKGEILQGYVIYVI